MSNTKFVLLILGVVAVTLITTPFLAILFMWWVNFLRGGLL